MTVRVGLLASHPVQYQVPWFRALAAQPGIDLTVFYALLPDAKQQGIGFDHAFQWDVPLLDGYRYEVLENRARSPSLATFRGCDTPSLHRIISRSRFDAFILTGWHNKSSLQGVMACLLARVPTIVRGESNALRQRPVLTRMAHRWLLRCYDAFLVIGSANERFYLQNGVSPRKLYPGLYCVDNDRFTAAAEALRSGRKDIRAAWTIAQDAFTFLFCGKLIAKKRPLDLLQALERLRATGDSSTPVHVLIAGDGPLRGEVESFIRERGLTATTVGFLNQTEIVRAYVAADALVLPSDYGETWGLVVNEAMACGLPAIVSDRVGCQQDLVLPGRTGLVFPFGDVAALAQALRSLATAPELARGMAQEARRVLGGYTVRHLVEGTLHALGTLPPLTPARTRREIAPC